ncbi:hypothetical protein E4M02_02485 [Brevundimonas sp. S30B]|uniref:hypothetical protein n=1 Tax=unclassified Brevundimonas TaxID=2622653 RepID=UPI001071A3AF|nr:MULTISPECIES: hypothetical protein [unclassified Brevundimonas]QBX37242.1 hypothetical protein E4M01_05335 [Brevundimonas sp. MF30-B]TFW03965.1 hypothetical protein E4M02_02485 [Brevundimonas sp. S30B]
MYAATTERPAAKAAAALRSVKAASIRHADVAPSNPWPDLYDRYLAAKALSDAAADRESVAVGSDEHEANKTIHADFIAARAQLFEEPATTWEAISQKAAAFAYAHDEKASWVAEAVALEGAADEIAIKGPDAIRLINACGHAERIMFYLCKRPDGFADYGIGLGQVGRMAQAAERLVQDVRDICDADPLAKAMRGAAIDAVWYGRVPFEQPAKPCPIEVVADEMSRLMRIAQVDDAKESPANRAKAKAALEDILGIETESFASVPRTQAGVAHQLIVAAGELDLIENGSEPEDKERALANVRAAICNTIRAMGLPFDTLVAEHYLGNMLADLDGSRRPGAAK